MKKNVLALSIATMIGGLGFSGAAMAAATTFEVNESGSGVIQIVPYFTVQDGNATVFHIVNTDAGNDGNAKAVKVRIRGASNSDDLMDFQVFLSPGDVWTAALTADADGLLQLTTADNSCTFPDTVRTDPVTKADTSRLKHPLWDTDAKKAAQTREGYIEILEMASIPKNSLKDAATDTAAAGGGNVTNPLWTAVKHVKTAGKMAAPCTSASMEFLDSIADGGIAEARAQGETAPSNADGDVGASKRLAAPTGSLVASWYIMNVAKSTTFSGSATALKAKAATPLGVPVYAPQLSNTTSTLNSADPLFGANMRTNAAQTNNAGFVYLPKRSFDVPDLSTPMTGTAVGTVAEAQAQAIGLTQTLARTSVQNQFYQDATLNAATDWVLSMPTRRYLVAANYEAAKLPVLNPADYIIRNGAAVSNDAPAGGNNGTGAAGAAGNISAFSQWDKLGINAAGQICVNASGQGFYDREEDAKTSGHVISPGEVSVLNLCGEVHVATFGAKSPVGAELAHSTFKTDFGAGWGSVNFNAGAQDYVPVLGSAFTAASNPNAAAGMVGNYGITWPHFYK